MTNLFSANHTSRLGKIGAAAGAAFWLPEELDSGALLLGAVLHAASPTQIIKQQIRTIVFITSFLNPSQDLFQPLDYFGYPLLSGLQAGSVDN